MKFRGVFRDGIILPDSGHALPDGTAEISFDLSDSVTTYRVIVAGHTLDGRLAEETVELTVGGEPRTK